MSRVCEICEKSSQKGNKIKVKWGLKYRSIRHRKPNLRKTKLLVDGIEVSAKVCANCLKSIKRGKYAGVTHAVQAHSTK